MEHWDIRTLDVEAHAPQVLRSSDEARAIAINLPAGDELGEHRTHEAAYLIVADGRLEVEADETLQAGPGFIAYFQPHETREVRAKEDSRLVLILGPWPGEDHPRRREAR